MKSAIVHAFSLSKQSGEPIRRVHSPFRVVGATWTAPVVRRGVTCRGTAPPPPIASPARGCQRSRRRRIGVCTRRSSDSPLTRHGVCTRRIDDAEWRWKGCLAGGGPPIVVYPVCTSPPPPPNDPGSQPRWPPFQGGTDPRRKPSSVGTRASGASAGSPVSPDTDSPRG